MILGIIPFAGPPELTEMTANMIADLRSCYDADSINLVAVANDPKVLLTTEQLCGGRQLVLPKNLGFGKAINLVIQAHLQHEEITDYLILNNDLEFPHKDWFQHLRSERESSYVITPCTDNTSSAAARADGPRKSPAQRAGQVSAFCWLVPRRDILAIADRFGFPLFDPEFFAYGEDDYTGAILRKLYGRTPFKVVPKAWVHHKKGVTGKHFGLRSGMQENIKLLKSKMQANKLK